MQIKFKRILSIILSCALIFCSIEWGGATHSSIIFNSTIEHNSLITRMLHLLFFLGGSCIFFIPLCIALSSWSCIHESDRILSSILFIVYCSYLQALCGFDFLLAKVPGGYIGQKLVKITSTNDITTIMPIAGIFIPLALIILITRTGILQAATYLLVYWQKLQGRLTFK